MSAETFKAGLMREALTQQVQIFFQRSLADLAYLIGFAGLARLFDLQADLWHTDIHPLPPAAFLTTDINVHKLLWIC